MLTNSTTHVYVCLIVYASHINYRNILLCSSICHTHGLPESVHHTHQSPKWCIWMQAGTIFKEPLHLWAQYHYNCTRIHRWTSSRVVDSRLELNWENFKHMNRESAIGLALKLTKITNVYCCATPLGFLRPKRPVYDTHRSLIWSTWMLSL